MNELLVKDPAHNSETILQKLTSNAKVFFQKLPEEIQNQLLMDRDPHGNIQLAQIDTQDLFIEMTKKRLKEMNYKGKFSPLSHYFGYEGRSANPSPFDADYTFSLGYCAALLINEQHSGYMACIKNLKADSEEWEIYGLPITSLLNMEERQGKKKPVIKKALVDLNSPIFHYFDKIRDSWLLEDHFNSPGPIQYFGGDAVCNIKNFTIHL